MNKLLILTAAVVSAVACKNTSNSGNVTGSASTEPSGSAGAVNVEGSGAVTITNTGSGSVTVNGRVTGIVKGSGQEKTETRQVGAFRRVELAGAMQAEITVGGAPSVVLRGDDNLLPMVETVVADEQLRIGTKGSIEPKSPLVAQVTAPALAGVRIDGANDVSIKSVSGDVFAIDVRGASKVAAAGKVHQLQIDVSGAAQVDVAGLVAEEIVLHASGAASVDVNATSSLDVTVAGTAHVTYRGKPKTVHQQISGVGTLEPK
jgi:hypothetical protein